METASWVTSGPMPSPARMAIFSFIESLLRQWMGGIEGLNFLNPAIALCADVEHCCCEECEADSQCPDETQRFWSLRSNRPAACPRHHRKSDAGPIACSGCHVSSHDEVSGPGDCRCRDLVTNFDRQTQA